MASESRDSTVKTHDEILARIRELTTGIRDGAAAAEEARTVPRETIDALLSAGITRILVPPRFGGYGLGLETWFEVVREIGKADASHAWCASLMIHHPHYISQFAEDAQRAVWAGGLERPQFHTSQHGHALYHPSSALCLRQSASRDLEKSRNAEAITAQTLRA